VEARGRERGIKRAARKREQETNEKVGTREEKMRVGENRKRADARLKEERKRERERHERKSNGGKDERARESARESASARACAGWGGGDPKLSHCPPTNKFVSSTVALAVLTATLQHTMLQCCSQHSNTACRTIFLSDSLLTH